MESGYGNIAKMTINLKDLSIELDESRYTIIFSMTGF